VRRALSLLLAGAALTGCTLAPRYVQPTPQVPASWPKGPAYAPAQPEALPAVSYREVFRDPKLIALIDQALTNNQSLRAAMANVEIARASYRVQRSNLFPSVDANADAGQARSRQRDAASATVARSYEASLTAAFELDLFGRLRSLSRAAQEQYFATEAGARAARLTLVGEVATAYLTFAADRTLLAIAADTVESATRTVTLTKARLDGGVAARTDLAQAETILQGARADVAELTTRVAQDRNGLELLVGGRVADSALPERLAGADGLLGEAPAGLDSRILLRRPDVLQAEHRLRAANAEIGAARAAFFPTISLTGLAGYASPALSGLIAGRNLTWQANGGATAPVFAGGANLANLAGAKAERRLAVAEYQGAIQAAFRDVADALARRGTIDEQVAAQEALLAAASDSYDLSSARYRAGVDPYLATLVAQRTLYVARQGLTDSHLAEALSLVALYVALGGDPSVETLPVTSAPRT
jgi:multidrug efflux system outer membrane protein